VVVDSLVVAAAPAFSTQHANPYNALLYTALGARGVRVEELSLRRLVAAPPDVVHVHWPELTFLSGRRWWRTAGRVVRFGSALAVARLRKGTRLVWTVHNLTPHEQATSPLQSRLFWWWFVRRVDSVLTLTDSARELARSTYPRLREVPAAVTPHGHYRSELDRSLPRAGARAALGLPPTGPVLAIVGQIRPYKNVPALLEAFARMTTADARLVVAGSARNDSERERIERLAGADRRVVLDLQFQEPARLSAWLAAADVVVLPYTAVLNSGTALLALSADRPVVVPAVGAMPELRAAVGEEWVYTYTGRLDDALPDAVRWAVTTERPVQPDLDAFDWRAVAELTERALREVTRSR
jgi:glycosyltransferase involved in cell wall biosynthesis